MEKWFCPCGESRSEARAFHSFCDSPRDEARECAFELLDFFLKPSKSRFGLGQVAFPAHLFKPLRSVEGRLRSEVTQ